MPHVVVSGITGCRNRGVEAFVAATIEQVRARRPDMEVVVLTLRPDEDAAALAAYPGGRCVAATARAPMDVWKHRLARVFSPGLSPLREVIEGASLLIVSGGDLFGPDYGASAIQFGVWPTKVAAHFGVPYAFQAQSIGPFHDAAPRALFADSARGAHHVAARENITREYLMREIGLPESRVPLVADPAFLLTPAPNADALLARYGIASGERFVAFSAARSLVRIRGVAPARLAEAWAAVVRQALDKWGVRVLFVPHVKEGDDAGNDGATAREAAALVNDPRVTVADESHRASEFKAMLARAEFVVSQRMHVAIGALSSGVPTAVIGFSVKYPGILGGVLGRDPGAEGLLFAWDDFIERNAGVLASLDRAWNRRAEFREWIAANLPEQKRLAHHGFDLLMEAAARP